jgi:lipoate-protein ligase A
MTFHLLHLRNYPIEKQLQLEKQLLQEGTDNICLINEGCSPTIVLGISGKEEELVDQEKTTQDSIPIVRRFSGGGTVIVDEDTLFVTFICQKELHDFPAYPEPIMRWTASIYQDVFNHPDFSLRENDYVLADKKCGGNAQYIKKHRWLHHTSFLWNFTKERMDYLLHPKKTPNYREGRTHHDFLCTLQEVFPTKAAFLQALTQALASRFSLIPTSLETLTQPKRYF